MLQNVMYDKTDLIDVANKNRIAAVQRAAYQNTLCSLMVGAEPQQARKTPVPHQRFGCFLQVVYTLALLASLFSLQQAPYWYNNLYEDLYEEFGLVFTDESGHRITPQAAYRAFKLVVTELGMPQARFHDLRHSYAVASLRSGDDAKTVQENLGHATAAFTLDVYGHVTEQMKTESANRMQAFIQSVSS